MNATLDALPAADLCSILYCSQATDLMTDEELARIIQTSRLNNHRNSITGLLVYGGGMFLQWLEGPRQELEELMQTLATDHRHDTLVTLRRLDGLEARMHPTWAMQSIAPEEIRRTLLECLTRATTYRQAGVIRLLVTLLDSQPLARLTSASPPRP